MAYEFIKGKYPNWVHKGEIGRKAINDWGYLSGNAGRRLRELYQMGVLERRINKSSRGSVEYRWKPILPKSPEKQEEESQLRLLEATR